MSKIGSFEFRLENFIKKVSFSDDFDVTDKLSVVGVLFRLINDSPELLIIKRSNHLRAHPGEWAFPGGKIDADDNDYEDTVLREINEELGIQSFNIKLLGRIKHFVTSSGFIVIPYLGVLKNGYSINLLIGGRGIFSFFFPAIGTFSALFTLRKKPSFLCPIRWITIGSPREPQMLPKHVMNSG